MENNSKMITKIGIIGLFLFMLVGCGQSSSTAKKVTASYTNTITNGKFPIKQDNNTSSMNNETKPELVSVTYSLSQKNKYYVLLILLKLQKSMSPPN